MISKNVKFRFLILKLLRLVMVIYNLFVLLNRLYYILDNLLLVYSITDACVISVLKL